MVHLVALAVANVEGSDHHGVDDFENVFGVKTTTDRSLGEIAIYSGWAT
jgi:hypothetical protein